MKEYDLYLPLTDNDGQPFFRSYKAKLKSDFDQLEVLIVERDVETL